MPTTQAPSSNLLINFKANEIIKHNPKIFYIWPSSSVAHIPQGFIVSCSYNS